MIAGPKRRILLLWENVLQGLGQLRLRLTRSLLTVMGVFIGVVIIIGVASVLNGFRQGIVDQLEQFGTDNIYVSRLPTAGMHHSWSEFRKRKELLLSDVRALGENCPALRATSPVLQYDSPEGTAVSEGQEMLAPLVRGVWPEVREAMNVEVARGRFFTHEETRHRAPVCVIGSNVVDALFPKRRAVGKSIRVEGQRLRVIGTMRKFPTSPAFGEENPDDSQIFIPYGVFREMFPNRKELFIIARAEPGRRAEASEQIQEVLRRRRKVAWNAENDFELETPDSYIAIFDRITGATIAVMFALSAVAFLVGGVGVMNVMLASVKERTREIGVRRAIGARRRDIVWQFLIEAMALTGAGGVLGVVFGEALMQGLAAVFPTLPCVTPMWARVFGFFGSVGVGLVFGLWPAVTAARLDPIEALRYE